MTHKLIKAEQVREAQDKLREWCEERHLTLETNRAGLVGNLLEELTEYERAKDVYDEIDALMDISVFSINAMERDFDNIDGFLTSEFCIGYNSIDYLIQRVAGIARLIHGGTRMVSKQDNEILDNRLHKALTELTSLCFYYAETLGYNPIAALNETIKEISSRTGHFDPQISKFVKDTSPEAQARWYKADYEKARYWGLYKIDQDV